MENLKVLYFKDGRIVLSQVEKSHSSSVLLKPRILTALINQKTGEQGIRLDGFVAVPEKVNFNWEDVIFWYSCPDKDLENLYIQVTTGITLAGAMPGGRG